MLQGAHSLSYLAVLVMLSLYNNDADPLVNSLPDKALVITKILNRSLVITVILTAAIQESIHKTI